MCKGGAEWERTLSSRAPAQGSVLGRSMPGVDEEDLGREGGEEAGRYTHRHLAARREKEKRAGQLQYGQYGSTCVALHLCMHEVGGV